MGAGCGKGWRGLEPDGRARTTSQLCSHGQAVGPPTVGWNALHEHWAELASLLWYYLLRVDACLILFLRKDACLLLRQLGLTV